MVKLQGGYEMPPEMKTPFSSESTRLTSICKLDMLEGYSEYYSETHVSLWNIQFYNNNHKS